MQDNLRRMLKVFENCNEFQQVVFIDAVNDLLNATFKKKNNINLDELPTGVDIRKLSMSVRNIITRKYSTTDELKKDFKKLQSEFKELEKNIPKSHDTTALFNFRKESVLFLKTPTAKEVKKMYGGLLGKDELNEIAAFRKQCIDNLIDKKIIKEFTIEDQKIFEIVKETIDSIAYEDEKGDLYIRDMEEIENNHDKSFIREIKSMAGGETKFKELLNYALTDFYVGSFTYGKTLLEELYENMSGEKIKKGLSYEYVGDTLFVRYDGGELEFTQGENPYVLLSMLCNKENEKGEVMFSDIFENLYDGEEFNRAYHEKEEMKIRNCASGINKRFKKISNNEKFLRIAYPRIIKLK